GLDIAVHDVAFVGELQRAARLLQDANYAGDGKGVAGIEQRLQAFAFHQLHGDEIEAVLFARVVHHDDVGMREETRGARFGLEPRQEFGPRQAGAFLAQANRLDGDGAPDDGVHGAIDHTHGSAAKFVEDFVTPRFDHRCHAVAATCPWPTPLNTARGAVFRPFSSTRRSGKDCLCWDLNRYRDVFVPLPRTPRTNKDSNERIFKGSTLRQY